MLYLISLPPYMASTSLGPGPTIPTTFLPPTYPGICTVSSQRSRIGSVAIYCATVFFPFSTYSSIYPNTASCIAVSCGGYYHLLQMPLRLPPCDPLHNPVLKTPQVPDYVGGHHPRLCPKNNNHLHHCLK